MWFGVDAILSGWPRSFDSAHAWKENFKTDSGTVGVAGGVGTIKRRTQNVSYFCNVWILIIRSILSGSLPVNFLHRWIFIGVIISCSNALAFTRSCVRSRFNCNTSCRISATLARPRLNRFFCERKLPFSIFSRAISSNRFRYCRSPIGN